MKDDAAGLFRAILAEPDDDLPRLHYADVIEASDPARAEFIRVQVELAPLDGRCDRGDGLSSWCMDAPERHHRDCRTGRLRRRERELLGANMTRWVCRAFGDRFVISHTADTELRISFRDGPAVRQQFSRGFVSRLTLSWSDWQRHAAALLAACPIANARDGLVRLTTPPEVQAYERPGGDMFCLVPGQRPLAVPDYAATTSRDIMIRLLAAEWPGVRFELPRTERLEPGITQEESRRHAERIRRMAQRQVNEAVANLRAQGIDCGPAGPVEVSPG